MSSSPGRRARGRASMAHDQPDGSAQRQRSTSRSGLPLPSTGLRANRYTAATQPTYDFLTGAGGGSAAPSPAVTHKAKRLSTAGFRQSLSASQSQGNARSVVEPTVDNEELRAKIKTLQYELDNLKQEHEYAAIQHEKDRREATAKAEDEQRLAHAEEKQHTVPVQKFDSLNTQYRELQDRMTNIQSAHDKDVRKVKEEAREAQDELEEARTDLASLEREFKHAMNDVESKQADFERTISDLRSNLLKTTAGLNTAKDQLARKEEEAAGLSSANSQLKSQAGDPEQLAVIKRELSEQVAHIRQLETTNRDQTAQLKILRSKQKAVEVVEEEKHALESRLGLLESVRAELREAQLQRQILEDERQTWTGYFREAEEFSSAEDMAKALVKQRSEMASLLERSGAVQAELTEREAAAQSLESERDALRAELEKVRSTSGTAPTSASESRSRRAVERQRALALKEVAFLREQLRAVDDTDNTMAEVGAAEQVNVKRIAELESQLDAHRHELSSLTSELSSLESAAPSSSLKRPHEAPNASTTESDRTGHLTRKNRKLQDDLSALQAQHAAQAAELSSLQTQLRSTRHRTRILSLRDNPTATFEQAKLSTITTLRQENADLHKLLHHRSKSNVDVVPATSLAALQTSVTELTKDLAEREKRMLRLKQIWAAKALEFREAVFSLLGWKVDFRANGKVSLSLDPGAVASSSNGKQGGAASSETGASDALIFDGEQGTMKVAGGMDSSFASEVVRPLTGEWVERRRYIPGLMASILLRQYAGDTTQSI